MNIERDPWAYWQNIILVIIKNMCGEADSWNCFCFEFLIPSPFFVPQNQLLDLSRHWCWLEIHPKEPLAKYRSGYNKSKCKLGYWDSTTRLPVRFKCPLFYKKDTLRLQWSVFSSTCLDAYMGRHEHITKPLMVILLIEKNPANPLIWLPYPTI